MSLAVGVPTVGPPTWRLVASLLGLSTYFDEYGQFTFTKVEGLPVDEARNELVRWFLEETRCEWLLQVDRDAILHPETAVRLMSWNLPIVSALTFTRYRPVVPTVYREHHPEDEDKYKIQIDETRRWIREHEPLWSSNEVLLEPKPADALTAVDFTGCHCLLVKRCVYEELDPPWFKAYAIDPSRYGEDRWFCEKARAAGFSIYVDRSVVAAHMYGEQPLGALDFLVWDNATDWKTQQINIRYRDS